MEAAGRSLNSSGSRESAKSNSDSQAADGHDAVQALCSAAKRNADQVMSLGLTGNAFGVDSVETAGQAQPTLLSVA